MKRILATVIILVLSAILIMNGVLAISPRKSYTVNESKVSKTRIVFMSSWAGVDSKSVVIEALIQKFNEENPDIEVVDMSLAGEDFLYTLKTGFASNEPPDVFGLWPGSDLEILIEKGRIADLRSEMDTDIEWKSRFDQAVIDNFMQGETLYSIPFEIIYEGLFVNKSLFEKYGVKIPSTIDELYEAVEKFRTRAIVPIAFNATPEGSFIIQNLMVASQGNFDTMDNFVYKCRTGLTDAVNILIELEQMRAFPKDYAVLDDYGRNQLFKNKEAAMIFQGSWFLDAPMADDEDVVFVPVPRIDETYPTRIIFGIGNGNFHISQAAYEDEVKREASIRFLKYLTSEDSVKSFSVLPGFVSSLKVNEKYMTGTAIKGLDEVHKAMEISVPVDHVVDRNLWESDVVGGLVLLLEDQIDLETFLETIFGAGKAVGVKKHVD